MFKLVSFILITLLAISNDTFAQANGMQNFKSEYSVNETITRLKNTLSQKNFKIFNHIDHAAGAHKNNIALRDTQLVIFGNPKIGSQLMRCSQTVAIDLPQKALVWKDKDDTVWLSFNEPKYLVQRHSLAGCEQLVTKITAALTNIANSVTSKEDQK